MDLIVRTWNNKETDTNYLTSGFVDDTTATGLLDSFKDALLKLNIELKKIYQVSMDGPNVNLKFLKDFKFYLKETFGDDHLCLIDIGTCSLHVVNNAYKAGLEKSGWNINTFLRSLYYLFKDFPTRRSTFSRITQSNEFPLKFCSIRWTENCKVMSRAKNMFPKTKIYINAVNKKPPKTNNFKIVKEFVSDIFLEAKLSFLISVCYDLESYLIAYQKNEPLLPFMYDDLFKMLKSLYSRILKPEIVKKIVTAEKLLDIDLNNKDNLCLAIYVDLGVAATTELKNLKSKKNAKESELVKFKIDCQTIILEICKKLRGKSPLARKFVKGASSLSPKIMLMPIKAKARLQLALEEMVESKYICSLESERIRKDYLELIELEQVKKMC